MALKRKIDKPTFDALSDAMKPLYVEKAGAYVLDAEDATELERSLNSEREESRGLRERIEAIEREKAEATEAARVAAEETARKKGDIEALETSWRTKLDAEKVAGSEREGKLKRQIEKLLVDNVAKDLAHKISVAPDLILPHVQKRLSAELSGEAPITRVLDNEGKPSALTLDDLEKDFVADTRFAAIIKGSNASGGSANSNTRGSGSAGKKISEMSELERIAAHKANPDEFNRRVAAGE